jgi:hypothetical protein
LLVTLNLQCSFKYKTSSAMTAIRFVLNELNVAMIACNIYGTCNICGTYPTNRSNRSNRSTQLTALACNICGTYPSNNHPTSIG